MKIHAAINNKLFKHLNYINDQLCEVELVKSQNWIQRTEYCWIFLICNMQNWECYSCIITSLLSIACDVTKCEKLEMDTDSLYLALFEKDLYDCIRPSMKQEWSSLRRGDCTDEFSVISTTSFFPRTCCAMHKKHDRRESGLFKEEFHCSDFICLCSKTYCCYDSQSNKIKFSSEGFNKRTLEDCGDSPMSKYRKVLEEVDNVTSPNRGFRSIQRSVTTYEQTKKGLSYFCPTKNVQQVGIHTRPLNK